MARPCRAVRALRRLHLGLIQRLSNAGLTLRNPEPDKLRSPLRYVILEALNYASTITNLASTIAANDI